MRERGNFHNNVTSYNIENVVEDFLLRIDSILIFRFSVPLS